MVVLESLLEREGLNKMDKKHSNPCYRCGNQRIVSKTWKEGVGINQVDVTLTVCPNPECQKTVNKELNAVHKKTVMMAQKKEERLMIRRRKKSL